jgi:ABC-type polysaccharide/polyol phosphate transport system ATPase subunit
VISLSEFYSHDDYSPNPDENGDEQKGSGPKLIKEVSKDRAIALDNVCVTYKTAFDRQRTLKQALTHPFNKSNEFKVVDAMKNISLEVTHGTVLGVIGHNGAGKSTMLRTMAGILRPTTGSIEVHGRVSTLLALGLGFNNNLSGRENVLLGGLAMGMSRDEVQEKYQQIAEFSELGDFIDLPIRTYSSGMGAKLAFSVAVHFEPDVLLVDEALSAGDARFKTKARDKMHELMSTARTIVVVSHALNTIADLCNEAIWLDHGRLMAQGEPQEIIERYMDHVKVVSSSVTKDDF